MSIQLFKAKDMKSAINLVNEEFGENAIIMSTKKNNGFVEVEASNNNNVIESHKKKIQEKTAFSKVFFKNLNQNVDFDDIKKTDNIEFLNNQQNSKETKNKIDNEKKLMSEIKSDISSLRKEINNMIITDDFGISDELSHFTPIKLKQEKFSSTTVRSLRHAYLGKSLEDGRISFFRELSKKLVSNDFSRLLKTKNIFIFGNSGSGKSTLSAKIASFISDKKQNSNINFVDVTNSSTTNSDILRSYSRVLGFSTQNYKNFNFNELPNNEEKINIFDFSGDLNFSIQKIKEIKNSFPSFNFCSILTVQSGSNSEMIKGVCKKVEDLRPMIAVTKLDECWVGSEEFSSLFESNARIAMVTGTKVLINSIIEATENSLTKYMKENFQGV